MGGVPGAHSRGPETPFHRSHLRSAPPAPPQRQAAVKLHRDFSPRRGSQDCAPGGGFAGPRAGTAGTSLIHSCTPELSGGGVNTRPYPARHLATSLPGPLHKGRQLCEGAPAKRVRAGPRLRKPSLRGLRSAGFTPGLQRRFARLYPGFTYRQWPGFSPRTHPLPGRGPVRRGPPPLRARGDLCFC